MALIAILHRIDLHFLRTRAIHVVTAAITAKGDYMNTAIEETGTAQAAEKPKAGKKASPGQKRADVGPTKGKVVKKAKATKKASKAAKKEGAARDGSKAAKILELLKRPEGATLAELMKTCLAGTLRPWLPLGDRR